jgi:hypothetical protein
MLLVLLMAFIMGQVVAWVYMWTHTGLSYSRMFVASLVVIPVIEAMVMVLMSGSIIVAFGLMAVFAVVRFRNVLKDTRDTTFILWSICLGIAVGTLNFSVAIMGCAAVGLVFLYLRFTMFGSRHRYDVIVSLHWLGEGPAVQALRALLKRHAIRIQMASQRAAADGGFDVSYRLLLRNPARSKELLAELQQMELVSQASLYLREDESEI